MYVIMYEMTNPLKISSPLPNSSFRGGFCSRALINLIRILRKLKIEKINKNKDTSLRLYILFLFSVI